ncbi:MAG: hypothetical protein A4E68_01619 [Syntrophaceae bacterium PtaB.Bin095]|nr:MAG: hypothetical protein A4E68_01619 [Syntrophaceae bacterium PtaB.Bin095]
MLDLPVVPLDGDFTIGDFYLGTLVKGFELGDGFCAYIIINITCYYNLGSSPLSGSRFEIGYTILING